MCVTNPRVRWPFFRQCGMRGLCFWVCLRCTLKCSERSCSWQGRDFSTHVLPLLGQPEFNLFSLELKSDSWASSRYRAAPKRPSVILFCRFAKFNVKLFATRSSRQALRQYSNKTAALSISVRLPSTSPLEHLATWLPMWTQTSAVQLAALLGSCVVKQPTHDSLFKWNTKTHPPPFVTLRLEMAAERDTEQLFRMSFLTPSTVPHLSIVD